MNPCALAATDITSKAAARLPNVWFSTTTPSRVARSRAAAGMAGSNKENAGQSGPLCYCWTVSKVVAGDDTPFTVAMIGKSPIGAAVGTWTAIW
jgi:hypothetical protein